MDLGLKGLKAVVTLGTKGIGSALDVADAPALKARVGEAAAALGGIDIVVANVSALAIGADEDSWRRGFEVDMMGRVRLVEAAPPALQASAAGSIVTISSVSGREIDFAAGPCGAFKAALIHESLLDHWSGSASRLDHLGQARDGWAAPFSALGSGHPSRPAAMGPPSTRSTVARPRSSRVSCRSSEKSRGADPLQWSDRL